MEKTSQFDVSQIRFDSESMQVLSMSRRTRKLDLPLVVGPVNFRVARSDGKFSNRWGVRVGGKGDAYIYNRDNPNAEKVSLHASGKQHISIREDLANSVGMESRFGNMWNEPEFDSKAIATFTLVFPPWGVGLESVDFAREIKKDELLIVGHREKLVVVGFYVVDSKTNLRGGLPHIVLARLPLKAGKTLHVIAWKEPQGKLMERMQETFPHAAQTFGRLGLGNGEYTMCVQGYLRPDSAYMVVFPVHYTSPKSEEIIKKTSERRRKAMQALADR